MRIGPRLVDSSITGLAAQTGTAVSSRNTRPSPRWARVETCIRSRLRAGVMGFGCLRVGFSSVVVLHSNNPYERRARYALGGLLALAGEQLFDDLQFLARTVRLGI